MRIGVVSRPALRASVVGMVALLGTVVGCGGSEKREPSSPSGPAAQPAAFQFRAASGYLVTKETWWATPDAGGRLRARFPANWVEVTTETINEEHRGNISKRAARLPANELEQIALMRKNESGYLFVLDVNGTGPSFETKDQENTTVTIKATCLSHPSMKPVEVSRVAKEVTEGVLTGLAKDLASSLDAALGDQKPLTKDDLASREKALVEKPVTDTLAAADAEQGQGHVDKAWELSGQAQEKAKAAGAGYDDLVARVETYRTQLRPTYISWLSTTATQQLDKGLLDEAGKLAELLAALPDQADAAAKLKASIAEKTPAVVAALVAEAQGLGDDECWKAYDLVNRALKLDPNNEEAKKLHAVVKKRVAVRMPSYVKDVYAQVEGNGFVVYYVLCNAKGQMVAAPGKSTILFYGENSGVVTGQYGQFSEEVAVGDFAEHEVGLGGAGGTKLMHLTKRLPWSKLGIAGLGTFDAAIVREQIKNMRIQNDIKFMVKVTFHPSHGKAIVLSAETHLP